MKIPILLCLLSLASFAGAPPNPNIDFSGFMKLAAKLEPVRQANRVGEDEFLRMMGEPATVVLDARTPDKFANIHIKGALSLPLTDFTDEALARAIPDKATRILIYCNNNFANEPANGSL